MAAVVAVIPGDADNVARSAKSLETLRKRKKAATLRKSKKYGDLFRDTLQVQLGLDKVRHVEKTVQTTMGARRYDLMGSGSGSGSRRRLDASVFRKQSRHGSQRMLSSSAREVPVWTRLNGSSLRVLRPVSQVPLRRSGVYSKTRESRGRWSDDRLGRVHTVLLGLDGFAQ